MKPAQEHRSAASVHRQVKNWSHRIRVQQYVRSVSSGGLYPEETCVCGVNFRSITHRVREKKERGVQANQQNAIEST